MTRLAAGLVLLAAIGCGVSSSASSAKPPPANPPVGTQNAGATPKQPGAYQPMGESQGFGFAPDVK